MTVYDLTNLFIEDSQLVEIWSNEKEEVIFKGECCDIPYSIECMEIMSIDTIYEKTDTITINVE